MGAESDCVPVLALGMQIGGGTFLKLRFMSVEVLGRVGRGLEPFFDGFSSVAGTAFGATGANAP